jgi:hypothetical protein
VYSNEKENAYTHTKNESEQEYTTVPALLLCEVKSIAMDEKKAVW